jgi:hypothetical protein
VFSSLDSSPEVDVTIGRDVSRVNLDGLSVQARTRGADGDRLEEPGVVEDDVDGTFPLGVFLAVTTCLASLLECLLGLEGRPCETMPSAAGENEKPLRGLIMLHSAASDVDLQGHIVQGPSFGVFKLDLMPFVLLRVEYPRVVEVLS